MHSVSLLCIWMLPFLVVVSSYHVKLELQKSLCRMNTLRHNHRGPNTITRFTDSHVVSSSNSEIENNDNNSKVINVLEGAITEKPRPQDMFAKYGIAYLLTSISFSTVSYITFYLLISHGVDVASLLSKLGIQCTTATSNAGTAAIAYAMHKAASPVRFPPTVAMTPLVAGWIDKLSNKTSRS